MLKRIIYFLFIVAIFISPVYSAVLPSTIYLTWGFNNDVLDIEPGEIISHAVLTIKNVKNYNDSLFVHLLDNPVPGVQGGYDGEETDYFGSHGVLLSGTYDGQDIYFHIGKSIEADGSIALTDDLCALLDYTGTGRSFGFGFNFGKAGFFSFYNVILDLEICTYSGHASVRNLRYKLFSLPDEPPAVNLLSNPDFEQGKTGWTCNIWNVLNDAGHAYSGQNSMQFTAGASTAGNYSIYQKVTVEPKTKYAFSSMVKNTTQKEMGLLVVYYSQDNYYLGHVYGPTVCSAEYEKTCLEFTTPSNCYSAAVSICIFDIDNSDSTIAYADSCVLNKSN